MQKRLWAMQLYVGVKRIYAGHDMHRIAGNRYITFFLPRTVLITDKGPMPRIRVAMKYHIGRCIEKKA